MSDQATTQFSCMMHPDTADDKENVTDLFVVIIIVVVV